MERQVLKVGQPKKERNTEKGKRELLLLTSQRDANDQKFKRKDGETLNQLIKAMAVAVSNLAQWF